MIMVNMGMPPEEVIKKRKIFFANNIMPLAIKPSNIKNTFLLLFMLYQNVDESTIFFQSLIKVTDQLEDMFIDSYPLNIKNIEKGSDQEKAYISMIEQLKENTLYGSSMITTVDKNYPKYYKLTGVRQNVDKSATVMDAYIDRDNYIKLKLYLEKLTNCTTSLGENFFESIFVDPKYRNIEFVNIEKVKHDATSKNMTKLINFNINHYTMNCGPSEYKFNYITPIDKDHLMVPLSNPLHSDLYDTFYSNDPTITDVIIDKDCEQVLLLYEEKSIIDNKVKSVKALKLTYDLVNKTNIVDCNNIIYKKGVEEI